MPLVYGPRVGIVMPNYNCEEHIGAAIESVVKQTYQDWVLCIIDDGSTDGSRDIIRYWYSRESRTRVQFLDENSGSPVKPRNEAIEYLLLWGEIKYIAFLDSDDWWHPEKLDRQTSAMHANPDSALTFHDVYLDRGLGNESGRWSQLSRPCSGHCFKELLFKNFIPSSSVMVKANILHGYPGNWHDPELTISHDWNLWLEIARFHNITYLPQVLGTLRMRGDSVTTQTKRRRKESRQVVRWRKGLVPAAWYYRCLGYYYMADFYDRLPKGVRTWLRKP